MSFYTAMNSPHNLSSNCNNQNYHCIYSVVLFLNCTDHYYMMHSENAAI